MAKTLLTLRVSTVNKQTVKVISWYITEFLENGIPR